MFRDDEQAVFTQRRGRPDVALVPLTLDENLRNARQVVDTFRPLVTGAVLAKAGDGFPIEYVEADSDDVFYSTVDGFKGLERPVVVLAVDGFHADLDPRHVLHTGMSRARDLLVVVGSPELIDGPGRSKVMRRLRHHERPRRT